MNHPPDARSGGPEFLWGDHFRRGGGSEGNFLLLMIPPIHSLSRSLFSENQKNQSHRYLMTKTLFPFPPAIIDVYKDRIKFCIFFLC